MIFTAIVKSKNINGRFFIKSEIMSHPISTVPLVIPDQDWELARHHAPQLYFDRLEPFLPLAVGYSIFTENAHSDSFKRNIKLPAGCTTAIEYAIWWDWDIQHLYELEHLWIYLDALGQVIHAEGSFHGDYHSLEHNDQLLFEKERLIAYSEPGKHAFATKEQLERLRPMTTVSCSSHAGSGDVLINHMFESLIDASPVAKRMCKRYMKAQAFTPSYEFSQRVSLATLPLLPWSNLKAWIPERIQAWLDYLSQLPKIEAVLLDCGDTLIDEGTEVKDAAGIVLSGEMIPGAKQVLTVLKDLGYPMALVADGYINSFNNLFEQQLGPYFAVNVISEKLGVEKPDARMFQEAIDLLGLEPSSQIVMVGNNLSRDILGANHLGLTSVWLDWAPRRAKIPACAEEVPHHTIKTPLELLSVLEQLEIELLKNRSVYV
jgi:beta-phosphoglucomutase-like phosphatase (HAD superfamily)